MSYEILWETLGLGTAAPGGWLLAYLDPGSGSFALQLLLAGALTSLYALKHYWTRVKAVLARAFWHRA
jgi:hypothetical protein